MFLTATCCSPVGDHLIVPDIGDITNRSSYEGTALAETPPIPPVSGTVVPRYAGPSTFCRLPELRDVPYCDVAILGIPFDSGTSYRPGARFGPQAIRQA
ncbi:MAG: hypothetical protein EP300_10580, partial [Gammaproteobacteria bacterium]